MTTAQTDTAQAPETGEVKQPGPKPFLRGIAKGDKGYEDTMVLWAHKGDAKTGGHGFVVVGGKREQVNVFFNDRDGKKSISLSHYVSGVDGAEGSWKTLASAIR